MKSPTANLDNRKAIWIALSEFYLDIELSDEDFDRTSEIFNASGFSIKELKEIELFEVFPFLQINLYDVAGVWEGFDEDWLIVECTKRYNQRNNTFYRMKCKCWNILSSGMTTRYWKQIEKRMVSFTTPEQ